MTAHQPIFIDTAAVARLLDMAQDHFLARRRDLEDNHGFPLPMPHWRRPMRWRADQVQGWIEAQGLPRDLTPPRPRGPNVVLFEKARTA